LEGCNYSFTFLSSPIYAFLVGVFFLFLPERPIALFAIFSQQRFLGFARFPGFFFFSTLMPRSGWLSSYSLLFYYLHPLLFLSS